MYILNVIYTLVVLILQLIASPMLAEKYTVERADLIKVAATIVSLLYLFEIVYRESMRTQMLIHHFAVSSDTLRQKAGCLCAFRCRKKTDCLVTLFLFERTVRIDTDSIRCLSRLWHARLDASP